ncbi:MAG: ankyrin repeat domain-containing protein [Myxococcales bacterium]|nr:ankyrin repeat domain-containing protein [Myxococcales bacterium]
MGQALGPLTTGCVLLLLGGCSELSDLRAREAFEADYVVQCEADRTLGAPVDGWWEFCRCVADTLSSQHELPELDALLGRASPEGADRGAERPVDWVPNAIQAAEADCRFSPVGGEWEVFEQPPAPVVLGIESLPPSPASSPSDRALAEGTDLMTQGELDGAIRAFHEALQLDPSNHRAAYQLACTHALAGRGDEALEQLTDAVDIGFSDYPVARFDPDLSLVRHTPHFQSELRRIKAQFQDSPPRPVGAPVALLPNTRRRAHPVVILLHGQGDSPRDHLEAGRQWAELGFVTLVVPGSFPWWVHRYAWSHDDTSMTHRQLLQALETPALQGWLDRSRVHLVGFGQGAQHAWQVAAQHPDVYAGMVAFSPLGHPQPLSVHPTPTEGPRRAVWLYHTPFWQSRAASFAERTVPALREAGWQVAVWPQQGSAPVHPAVRSSVRGELAAFLLGRTDAPRGAVDLRVDEDFAQLLDAAELGERERVEALAADQARVNGMSGIGRTPLLVAAEAGHIEIVADLLEAGADPSQADPSGRTPLMAAMETSEAPRIAQALLEAGADPRAVTTASETALLAAAAKQRVATLAPLLEAGADIEAVGFMGRNALDRAARWAPTTLVRWLIDEGAAVRPLPPGKGSDALTAAAGGGRLHTVRFLLPLADWGESLDQALVAATRGAHLDIARMLLDAGARPAGRVDGTSAWHEAADMGNIEVITLLAEQGAQVDTMHGFAALHYAAYDDDPVLVNHLIEVLGAEVDVENPHALTPLHIAAFHGRNRAARALLEHGADPHRLSSEGHTPLHDAATSGHADVARTLLRHGAHPGVRNPEGHRPLDLAEQQGHLEVSRLLRSREPRPFATGR